jgi:hypothetical protein
LSRGNIVVAGALAQKPRHGGHAWVLLQYLLGFKRLGWDVLFLDRATKATPTTAFLRVMREFELDGQYALLFEDSDETLGLSYNELLERVRNSAVLLNVMGYITDPTILEAAPKRVFLDIDPGFPQMWRELGLHDAFAGHNAFVTIGENIGQPDCAIPTCGLDWITSPQPVVLEHWPATPRPAAMRFTSVASWRGAYGPVEYHGTTYGLRVHAFREFAMLPCLTSQPFELALDIHPSETNDLDLLACGGWSLVDPACVASDRRAYRDYIQRSAAEFMVAKHMYAATRSGWFSDRSICYLASGKPVVAHDTGLGEHYPLGRGLLAFRSLDEAGDAVGEVAANYNVHAGAAREIAEEYFNSDKVLARLLSRLGVV